MKKLSGILILGFLYCNTGTVEEKEPGKDEICFKIMNHEFAYHFLFLDKLVTK